MAPRAELAETDDSIEITAEEPMICIQTADCHAGQGSWGSPVVGLSPVIGLPPR